MPILPFRMRRLAAVLALAAACTGSAPAGRVELHVLDCGRIDIADMDAFADDGSYAGIAALCFGEPGSATRTPVLAASNSRRALSGACQ